MYFYKQPGIVSVCSAVRFVICITGNIDVLQFGVVNDVIQPKSSQKPEAVLDLLNADIRTGTEVEQLSSRKHVLSVQTLSFFYTSINLDFWLA